MIIEFKENGTITKHSLQLREPYLKIKIKQDKPNKITKPDMLYNSICRIEKENDKNFGSGFFMQIILENELFYFLITSKKILSSEQIDNGISLNIFFFNKGKEEKRKIKIKSHKRTHFVFYQEFETTLLEILDSDDIPYDIFLKPDLDYSKGYDYYMNKGCYIVGFEKINNKSKKFLSLCEITNMSRFEFNHNSIKGPGSLGSVICSKDNFNVIGINKQGDLENKEGCGCFIGKILNYLENNRKGLSPKNYISMFQGRISYGLRQGEGSGFYLDGGLYEGNWVNGQKEGFGTMFYSNGNVYIGNWNNDRREGIGKFYFCKGGIYEGEFKDDIINGYGTLFDGNGKNSLKFVGTLKIRALDNPNFDVFHFLSV